MFDRDTCVKVFQELPEERKKDIVQLAVDMLAKETLRFFLGGGSLEDFLRE